MKKVPLSLFTSFDTSFYFPFSLLIKPLFGFKKKKLLIEILEDHLELIDH